MVTDSLTKEKAPGTLGPKFTIDYNMRDYSDCSFFKKELERAKASIAKYGLPDFSAYIDKAPEEAH